MEKGDVFEKPFIPSKLNIFIIKENESSLVVSPDNEVPQKLVALTHRKGEEEKVCKGFNFWRGVDST